jgi:hypothetical protein
MRRPDCDHHSTVLLRAGPPAAIRPDERLRISCACRSKRLAAIVHRKEMPLPTLDPGEPDLPFAEASCGVCLDEEGLNLSLHDRKESRRSLRVASGCLKLNARWIAIKIDPDHLRRGARAANRALRPRSWHGLPARDDDRLDVVDQDRAGRTALDSYLDARESCVRPTKRLRPLRPITTQAQRRSRKLAHGSRDHVRVASPIRVAPLEDLRVKNDAYLSLLQLICSIDGDGGAPWVDFCMNVDRSSLALNCIDESWHSGIDAPTDCRGGRNTRTRCDQFAEWRERLEARE